MKNLITYYYKINIDNMCFNNDKYIFTANDKKYMFLECNNINIISYCNELNYQLDKYNYFFKFILNKDNSYVTVIENKTYIIFGPGLKLPKRNKS